MLLSYLLRVATSVLVGSSRLWSLKGTTNLSVLLQRPGRVLVLQPKHLLLRLFCSTRCHWPQTQRSLLGHVGSQIDSTVWASLVSSTTPAGEESKFKLASRGCTICQHLFLML